MHFFYMPTKIIFEEKCLFTYKDEFKSFGKKCLIVTGKSSARKSGALSDLLEALEDINIEAFVFDEIMENPTFEILQKAINEFRNTGIDFVVGIGGGSPLDGCKMIGVLLENPTIDVRNLIFTDGLLSKPIIAIPTTSGSGSEATPYSIITDHKTQTKLACMPRIFPKIAFLDTRYYITMPDSVIRSTAVDALCHLVEGFLVKKSNCYSDEIAMSGLKFFVAAMNTLKGGNFTKKMHENLIHASTFGGIVISHTGTGIPHGFGYHLTYNHGVYHGKATALFLGSMVEMHISKQHKNFNKGYELLKILGFETPLELRQFIIDIVGSYTIRNEAFEVYTEFESKRKLKNHDFEITKEDIKKAFKESLIIEEV